MSPENSKEPVAGKPVPIVDLHCDMLHYLATEPWADAGNREDIGCALPWLSTGNVKMQVMAAYSGDGPDSVKLAKAQCRELFRLEREHGEVSLFRPIDDLKRWISRDDGVTVMPAVENASGLCAPGEPIEAGTERLGELVAEVGVPLYVSLTYNLENRFGGGSKSTAGLKDDGRILLERMNDYHIALDIAHACDRTVFESLEYIERQGLNVPVIASHSNFRTVYDCPRNLPDELAVEIFRRGGLVGINFLRAMVHPDDPDMLRKHILHGFELGGEKALCFGADFFCLRSHPDQSRQPFFFEEHANAARYQEILASLEAELGRAQLESLACGNALRFIARLRK